MPYSYDWLFGRFFSQLLPDKEINGHIVKNPGFKYKIQGSGNDSCVTSKINYRL